MAKKPKALFAGAAELWPLERILPWPTNPRTHPPAQVTLLAGLMKRYGIDQPIVVDEGGFILKGHGRRLAALEADFADFPVVVRRGLSETDKSAMRLQDNQVALLAGWDQGIVRTTVADLKLAGYDIPLLGFSEATLRGWGSPTDAGGAEVVPPLPKKPVVRFGDLWDLGRHRLLCGDATEDWTWKRLLGPLKAAMVFTDPPYGVSYKSENFGVIEGDKKRRDDLYKMLLAALRRMAEHTAPTAAFYIWHASSTREDFAGAMKAAGLVERQYLIWVKPAAVFGRADYQWQHEPCFYASKPDQAPAFYGERAESTVWHAQLASAKDTAAAIGNGIILLDGEGGTLFVQARAPKNKKLRHIRITKDTSVFLSGSERQDGTVWEVARDGQHEHPTQKPVELARRAIENSSRPGEIVADGFLGSGTTLIGAELTARRCFGAELDPVYAEVVIRRWEKLTGHAATLDGKTLEAIARERRQPPARAKGAAKRKRAARDSRPPKSEPAARAAD